MEFAKYYDVTKVMNEMIKNKELIHYEKDDFVGLYICKDVRDFWIARVSEGLNSDYEIEEGTFLIEREKLGKYDFIEFYVEKTNKDIHKKEIEDIINSIDDLKLIKNLILYDDYKGLEGWDNLECNSLNEVIENLDDGFGIKVL
jgi:hypothetical protein